MTLVLVPDPFNTVYSQHPLTDAELEMFREFVCAVLLAALVSPSQEHAVGNATCELQFQEHIKAAIAVKRKCEKAVFDNCYQVSTGKFSLPIYFSI